MLNVKLITSAVPVAPNTVAIALAFTIPSKRDANVQIMMTSELEAASRDDW
jgi:hypothetical protein